MFKLPKKTDTNEIKSLIKRKKERKKERKK